MTKLLAFLCGAAATGVLIAVFSLKLKRPLRFIVRMLVGIFVTAFLALTGNMPMNGISAACVGLLGAPGLIATMAIVCFL